MTPSQVVLPLNNWVPLLVDDQVLEMTELWALVNTILTKYSWWALVPEVEAVDPVIALALDTPVATELEAEYSLELDAHVATELEV